MVVNPKSKIQIASAGSSHGAGSFQFNHQQLAIGFPSAPGRRLSFGERIGAGHQLFGSDQAAGHQVGADFAAFRIQVGIDLV